MSFSLRLYRLLLKLYPVRFREEYSGPLQRQFRDDYADVRGGSGLVRFWGRTLLDFVRSMPEQLACELAQDARLTVRLWRRRPLHTFFVVSVLAIGIGANTGVFSVLNALLLRSLPFNEPDRLAYLHQSVAPWEAGAFHAWRQESSYLADAASFIITSEVNAEASGEGTRMRLTQASSNFFSLLGVQPARGRLFAPGEDVPGSDAVAVIGHGLWQRLFGGGPGAVGSSIRVNGAPLTVIGIAPPGFDYPERTDVWSPTRFDPERIPKTVSAIISITIGRLKPRLTWAQARQAFEVEVYRRSPEMLTADPANRPALVPLQEQLAGHVRQASVILMVGVGLLLLLACANVANVFMARTVARSNELTIRTALGASRARLTQQLLTETVLLSAVATAAGLVLAFWTAGFASSTEPARISSQSYTILDWRVLTFAITLSFVTALLFGVGPALYVNRLESPNSSRNATAGERQARTRKVLIGAQIAVTIVLLTSSLALGRAFLSLLRVDNGYEFQSVATMNVSLAGTGYDTDVRAASYYDEVFPRLRHLPGVISVGATESLPLSVEGFMGGSDFTIDGIGNPSLTAVISVAPGYFAAIGGEVLHGREFAPEDLKRSELLAVVSEEFARYFGDPSTVVGKFVSSRTWPARRVVGVVRGMRYTGPMFNPASMVYWLSESPRAVTIVAKVNGPARDRIAMIRDAVRSVDPRVPVFDVKTMDERLDAALARPRLYTTATVFFGGLALLVAMIGIYGILSYLVVQRTREMGIRLALGATPARLRATLLGRTFVIVAIGVAIGGAAAAALARYLQSLVPGADALVPESCALAVTVTVLVAASAIWLATRHIVRLNTADVLRAESAE